MQCTLLALENAQIATSIKLANVRTFRFLIYVSPFPPFQLPGCTNLFKIHTLPVNFYLFSIVGHCLHSRNISPKLLAYFYFSQGHLSTFQVFIIFCHLLNFRGSKILERVKMHVHLKVNQKYLCENCAPQE